MNGIIEIIRKYLNQLFCASLFVVALSGCDDPGEVVETFTIGGTAAGITHSSLLLHNNGGDTLLVYGDGSFTFVTAIPDTNTYNVTIAASPEQTCNVTNGSGAVTGTNITNVTVNCVDDVPPTATVSPIDGAINVDRSTSITVNFNENMFASTIDDVSFTLSDSNNISGTVSFNPLTNIATFIPLVDLALLSTYTADLDSSITDLVGNALSPLSWSFTSRDGTWDTETLIENENLGNAFYPKIDVDSNGNALTVWQQRDGVRENIWSNRYTSGIGWGTATLIESNTGDAISPQLVIDSNGNALAVWQQSDGIRNNIWSNRYTLGTGWGVATLIESDNAGDAVSPQIAIDNNGNALAVWTQHDGTRGNIWSNSYTSDTGWGAAIMIESGDGKAFGPQIAVNNSGNALAVWHQKGVIHDDIWSNRYTVGAGWGTAELIESDNVGPADFPQIAIDNNGNALAVWNQYDGIRHNIISNRYVSGVGWGSATVIESENAGHALSPQIAIDTSGNAIAGWFQNDGVNNKVWINRFTFGVGWGTAMVFAGSDYSGTPQIAIDANGNALVLWSQSYGGQRNLLAKRYIIGTGWSLPTNIESGDYSASIYPSIVIDSSGSGLVVWSQSDGTQSNILSNRFD